MCNKRNKRFIMNNLKNINVRQSKSQLTSLPIIEITHYDFQEKESLKETYPISYFLDGECKKLKSKIDFN